MKKGFIITGSVITALLVFLIGFYIWGMGAVSKNNEEKIFIIEAGSSKTTIAKNLETSGLIRSQYVLDLYLFFSKNNIQAGEYVLSPSMKPTAIIKKFHEGDIKINSVTVTLIEGERITDYADTLSESLNLSKDEFLTKVNDLDYLKTLVDSNDYWFLTADILNAELYYPLEGYLFPDTYEFLENATPEMVIETILEHTKAKLDPYRDSMEENDYSVHELLTLASIVEKEANTSEDRKKSAQVFYLRLHDNWSLGSDVTSYYGVRKKMGDPITVAELEAINPYNTRLTDGTMNGKLPIGPISNPSLTSIEAVIHPSATNYYFFVANVCTGEVFFLNTYEEFNAKVDELHIICSAN